MSFSRGKSTNNQGRAIQLPPTVPIQHLLTSPSFPITFLENRGDLRIAQRQIKPLAGSNPKAGSKADVEAATLAPANLTHNSKYNFTEYVAVKKVRFDDNSNDNRVLAAFVHEIELVDGLCHDNIVKIIGFVEDIKNGIAWMVFSWEQNGNLREFVRSASWELPERVSLGISYLHGRNPPVCHGDLKSLNILVNSDSQALITDFGSARAIIRKIRLAR
ncbi:hypothetical protein M407DRAFT_25902 [Tulasnella calospora MUT 4182]|uniref:Protein kinase domain-containing protein n=1 Tax=Tulasnella calospora MUT 4182 TaxID=1051891 RepID=A0A0C3KTF6_9AGAM|nr:hypothetical protein M407DRAFT_25902 [Tulasnella calospora MUT 4182]